MSSSAGGDAAATTTDASTISRVVPAMSVTMALSERGHALSTALFARPWGDRRIAPGATARVDLVARVPRTLCDGRPRSRVTRTADAASRPAARAHRLAIGAGGVAGQAQRRLPGALRRAGPARPRRRPPTTRRNRGRRRPAGCSTPRRCDGLGECDKIQTAVALPPLRNRAKRIVWRRERTTRLRSAVSAGSSASASAARRR